MTSASFSETVKQQADIVRVIGEYVKLKKAGAQNFTGLCPFHQEKTPSFSVHAARQFYHCFGCSASGDVFSFVQKIENLSFPEAVRVVAEKCGIALPKFQPSSPQEAKDAGLRAKLIALHQVACEFFEQQLRRPEAAAAREYLAGRGLQDEAIARFRMGYAPESGFLLRDRLRAAECDAEILKASGLLSWKQEAVERQSSPKDEVGGAGSPATPLYARFRGRIMFPIANESGKIIAFTGRAIVSGEKSGPKYLNSPETAIYSKSRVLFNLDGAREAIRKLDYAILVEGQMDCVSVFVAGFHNVIATSGTAFTEPQARLLGRYTKNIVVNFDPDAAGAAAAERSLALLVSEDFRIKVLTLDSGFDPDLFIRRQGAKAYAEALRTAPDYFDHLIRRAQSAFRAHTAEGKVQAVNFLLPHLQAINNRIRRDQLASEMAQKLGIDSAVLRQELKHAALNRARAINPPMQAAAAGAGARAAIPMNPAEKIILRALATPGGLREETAAALAADQLAVGLESEAMIAALLAARNPEDFSALDLEAGDRSWLAAILMDESEELTSELVTSALAALRRRQMERRQRALQSQIAAAERKADHAAVARLAQEKISVDRALAVVVSAGAGKKN